MGIIDKLVEHLGEIKGNGWNACDIQLYNSIEIIKSGLMGE